MQNNKETKGEAFKRLAQKRTNAVIEKIRILSHCANHYYYEYSDDDVRKIFGAIDEEIRTAKGKFTKAKLSRTEFRLG